MIGRNIEHYKIIEILGQGGMGIVYKAFDLKLERFVALKILNSDLLSNPHFLERFKREAKHQAKINHPNIVPVYGFAEENGILGIIMEYVSGETVESLIKRLGRLELQYALSILKQILAGIGYAHFKGFIHRDIKPSNIILNNEGVVKIMDFGISKSLTEGRALTKTGTKIGTLLYMSPEQVKAKEPSNQSDIYSLGITFFEMLVGRTPFDTGTDYEIMEAHLKKNPAKVSSLIASVPPAVDTIIAKAVQKSLSKRYATCEDFLNEVNQLSIELLNVKTEKEKKKTKIKFKTKAKQKIFLTGDQRITTVKQRSKYFLWFSLTILLFAALVYFVYNTVSKFWINDDYISKVRDTGKNTYVSNPAYILKSNWIKIESPTNENLNSVTFVNSTVGFSCGNNGVILKTTDSGNTWFISDSSITNILYKINFSDNFNGIAVGEKGMILLTNNGGQSWDIITSKSFSSLFDYQFIKGTSIVIAVGANGTIIRSEDGGYTWNRVSSHVNKLLYSVKFINEDTGIIVGWSGEILKSNDMGKTWHKITKFTTNYLRSVDFVTEDTGFIVGGGGEIYKTTNGGSSWKQVPSNTISGLLYIKFIDDKNGFILGNKGDLLTTSDSGEHWEKIPSGTFSTLKSLTINDNKSIFITGNNGLILKNILNSN
ncbi:MAG: protein kinase [Bacteroidetes bacterium]|nr:protein kinase [Bacteroidota bacterium]